MATTQKGIYYPDDYTAIADIPEDMKDLAESVDTALGDLEDNIEQNIQPQIDDIVSEQTTQNNEIEALQIENARLKATLPTTTGSGENITLQNTAELEFIQPPLPKGNSEQVQYSGKNKLNNTVLTEQKTTNGITATPHEDGSITLNGTATATTFFILTNTQNFGDTDFSSANNASDSYKATLENSTGYASLNYTHGNTTTAIRISSGITINNITVYPMILLKSETNESYEPYVGGTASPNPSYPQAINNVIGDVEVLVQNKNIFDEDNVTFIVGILDDNGNNTGSTSSHYTENFYQVKPETQYVISGTLNTSESGYRIYFYDENKGWLSRTEIHRGNYSFTTPANCKYIRIQVSILITLKTGDVQLEQNTTATTYTPHKEQTFTFPLGTQRMYLGDYLADDGIHHVRDVDIFDGSNDEVWALIDAYFVSPYVENVAKGTVNSICNIATIKTLASLSATDINKYAVQTLPNGSSRFYFRCSQFRTLDDWKAYLAENPITVEYELATEEITPYTAEQQQAYDEIKQAISYEEQTNISGSSDESNPLFSVEAYQSIKLILAS